MTVGVGHHTGAATFSISSKMPRFSTARRLFQVQHSKGRPHKKAVHYTSLYLQEAQKRASERSAEGLRRLQQQRRHAKNDWDEGYHDTKSNRQTQSASTNNRGRSASPMNRPPPTDKQAQGARIRTTGGSSGLSPPSSSYESSPGRSIKEEVSFSQLVPSSPSSLRLIDSGWIRHSATQTGQEGEIGLPARGHSRNKDRHSTPHHTRALSPIDQSLLASALDEGMRENFAVPTASSAGPPTGREDRKGESSNADTVANPGQEQRGESIRVRYYYNTQDYHAVQEKPKKGEEEDDDEATNVARLLLGLGMKSSPLSSKDENKRTLESPWPQEISSYVFPEDENQQSPRATILDERSKPNDNDQHDAHQDSQMLDSIKNKLNVTLSLTDQHAVEHYQSGFQESRRAVEARHFETSLPLHDIVNVFAEQILDTMLEEACQEVEESLKEYAQDIFVSL